MGTISRVETSSGPLTIRRAQPGDSEGIRALFEAVYGRRKSLEEYRWLYERNPSGTSSSWVAVDEKTGQVVGARSAFPWRIKIGGQEVLASQSGEAMTHPDWRRRGIFTTLLEAAWTGLRDKGISFSYSFPNQVVLSVLRKLRMSEEGLIGVHAVGNLCRWIRPVCWEALAARRLGSSQLFKTLGRLAGYAADLAIRPGPRQSHTGPTVRAVERFDLRYDDFWSAASRPFSVIAVRDSAFLNWRFIDTPNRRHVALALEQGKEILGYAAVELIPINERFVRGRIHDILVAPEGPAFNALMDGVLRWFREARATHVAFTLLEGHPYEGRLRRWGFLKKPQQQAFSIQIYTTTPWSDLLLDARNWFVTLGDRDIESGD